MSLKPRIRATKFSIPKEIKPIQLEKKIGLDLNFKTAVSEKRSPYLEIHKTMYFQGTGQKKADSLELVSVKFCLLEDKNEIIDLDIIECGDCVEIFSGHPDDPEHQECGNVFSLYIASYVDDKEIILNELMFSEKKALEKLNQGFCDFILGKYNDSILKAQNEIYLKTFGITLVEYLRLHKAMFTRNIA